LKLLNNSTYLPRNFHQESTNQDFERFTLQGGLDLAGT